MNDNVQKKIEQFLTQNKYSELANFLEQEIELNPDDITLYSYRGLAYFLLEDELQAQTSWFFIVSNEDPFYQQQLQEILNHEAQKQLDHKNYQLSYELRNIIQGLIPNSVDNLLLIIELAIKLNIFDNNYLFDSNLNNIIKQSQTKDINFDILKKVFGQILEFPLLLNPELAKQILENQQGNKELINLILEKARYMGHGEGFPNYSADLALVCLEYLSNNLAILNEIISYNDTAHYFDKSEAFSKKYLENSHKPEEKAYGYYKLIYCMMRTGTWQEKDELINNYICALSNLSQQNPDIEDLYIIERLVFMTQYLLYFRDSPQENRQIINSLSCSMQKLLNNKYSYIQLQDNFPIKNKKMKIGYLGYTFRSHCVGLLSRWLIKYLDRNKFDIYIYLIGEIADNITEKWFKQDIKKFATLPKEDIKIAQIIKEDSIDILIDVDCFTNEITQRVMALKPAPIQVSWLGLDSTGIPAIDYFVVDNQVLPKDAQKYYQEKLWRLPHTYLAVDGFEIDSASSIKRKTLQIPEDALVYLSLQTGLKRHPDSIRLQMKVLKQVPESYFLISGGSDETTKHNVINLFKNIAEEEGIKPERIKVLPFLPVAAYRATLMLGDVVLDTYPFNGATTTLDALWLNIPLVTRVGQQFHARQGYTFLTNLGIEEGIAHSDVEYIEWGVRFGTDEELRKKVHWKLRESKKTSPLWNAREFTKEMEKAYEQMWEIYIDSDK
ncbi:MAG: O-linked N-acetylglucosamine transferase, SPINDLY family protein [Cyanobacterium sp.]